LDQVMKGFKKRKSLRKLIRP